MRIVVSKYKGYNGQNFIFLIDNKEVKFNASEITALRISDNNIAKLLSLSVDNLFRVAVFWDNYGYYVLQKHSGVYELFDAMTDRSTGEIFPNSLDIPKTFNDKPIQHIQRKILISEIITSV
jgi:hypothetical protein